MVTTKTVDLSGEFRGRNGYAKVKNAEITRYGEIGDSYDNTVELCIFSKRTPRTPPALLRVPVDDMKCLIHELIKLVPEASEEEETEYNSAYDVARQYQTPDHSEPDQLTAIYKTIESKIQDLKGAINNVIRSSGNGS